ncbi:MAG: hypothetical protein ACE5FT_07870 [Candidatus Nanoarchaeia archaeon]
MKKRNLLIISLLVILTSLSIQPALAASICQNPRNANDPVYKNCPGFSYCDKLYSDGYEGEGSYCGGNDACVSRRDNHYHDGWFIWPGIEWHTSVCEAEGHPCGQGNCYQTMWDYWDINMAPGCWDEDDDGRGWTNEYETDCIYYITGCACGDGDGDGGACPFVSTWNGTDYVLDNNLLPASEASNGSDVVDYYKLQQPLVPSDDGVYSLLLSEFEQEHNFFDHVKLLAVDHSSNVSVAVSPYGEILTYTDPYPAVSAITNDNENVKFLLNAIDGDYYDGYNGSYISLNFGDELDVSQGAKLVMRADVPIKEPYSIHVQVQDEDNNWNTVATLASRVYWATEIIDLSEYLPDAKGNLKVRLYFTANHKVNFVGLDTSPQATIDIHEAQLISAIHSTNGDVTAPLLYSDEAYAELVPEQQIELTFTLLQQIMEARDYIILIEGHYYTIKT